MLEQPWPQWSDEIARLVESETQEVVIQVQVQHKWGVYMTLYRIVGNIGGQEIRQFGL